MPVRKQRLVYDNVSMANERMLADYHIPRWDVLLMNSEGFDRSNDMLHLLNGKTVLLNKLELSDTVEKVKMVTRKMEKIPSSLEIVLQFKNQRMEDDRTTLKDYELTYGATLLEVLEAMAQMSEPPDRFEAVIAQARNPNLT